MATKIKIICLLLFLSIGLYGQVERAPRWTLLSDTTLQSLTGINGVITPKLIGGTGTTSDLWLQTTNNTGATGADMHFLVGTNGATEAMTILNDGKVGIGTTNPTYDLQVTGTISASGSIESPQVWGALLGDAGNVFRFLQSGSNWINGGDLGLGTATPQAKFSLVGTSPIMYATDSDVNLQRTSLAFATDTSAIKIDASVAQPAITIKNTTGGGYIATTTTGTSVLTSLLGVMTLVDSTGLYSLTTAVAGWGEVLIGDNQEWAHFRFTTSGVVTLIANSTNVSTTVNTENKLNIYDAGTGIAIQNNLGSDLKLAVDIKYYTP